MPAENEKTLVEKILQTEVEDIFKITYKDTGEIFYDKSTINGNDLQRCTRELRNRMTR